MAVTSLTTIAAFVLTSTADIPAVSTFGVFAAIVVLYGYLLVISWYLLLLSIADNLIG